MHGVGSLESCTRHAAIRPNKHQRTGIDRSISQANLLDLLPARFPKMGRTGSFRSVRIGKDSWALGSLRKVPVPKWKTAILQRMCSAYWVLSQLALCSPNHQRVALTQRFELRPRCRFASGVLLIPLPNSGGDFSTMNKRDHFVECFGRTDGFC